MRPPSRPWQRAVAMAATATAAVLANPTFDLWPLSFVILVPYLWATEGLTARRAFVWGWLGGTVAVFWGFFWIQELLTRFAGVPAPLAPAIVLLFALAHGVQFAVPAALTRAVMDRTSWPAALTLPVMWVAAELVLPTIFPMYLAITWAWHPAWIQLAELGGVTAVSFALVAISGAAYDLLRAWPLGRRARLGRAGVLAAIVLAVPAYGAARLATLDAALAALPRVPVGLVQGNMSIEEVLRPGEADRILAKHQRMSARLEREGARLLVWGETAYPYGPIFGRDAASDLPPSSAWRVRRGFSVPLVLGLVTVARDDRDEFPWNSVWVLREDGTWGDRYDKVYRLIFGEYVPLVDPKWFQEIFPTASHLHRGAGPAVLRVDGLRLGPLICYEDILPNYAADVADLGIHAFVNLTNDAWFGKTHEPAQHLALAVFRTVEHRRAMVRAVTTGITAHIDPGGRVLQRTRATDPEVDGPQPADGLLADVVMVPPGELQTPYARLRWLWNLGLPLLALGMLVLALRRDRARPRPPPR